MTKLALVIISSFTLWSNCFSQSKINPPYKCGYFSNSFEALETSYNNNSKKFECKKGEIIASIGASNGYVEVQIATFIDSIKWYIQDIDTACLNNEELQKVILYHEKLKGSKIIGNFNLVIGDIKKTNLPVNTFDRVLMANVYHELTDRKNIMSDVYRILKPEGVIVIMERMANRKGKMHHDCNNPMLYEPDFITEMKSFSFTLIKITTSEKSKVLRYYLFKKLSSP